MPYSVRWPNEDFQVIIGTPNPDIGLLGEYKFDFFKGRHWRTFQPMLRGVLIDCIDPSKNSKRLLNIRAGYLGNGRSRFADKVWVTMVLPKACERDNPRIERLLNWTLHACITWAALASGHEDIDRNAMGDVAAHLHTFEQAGYKAAKQCRVVLHSAMIGEILPWKVKKPRRVKFKTSDWQPTVNEILFPDTIGKYSDPYDLYQIDSITDVTDARKVVKFTFEGWTFETICATVIATVDELDAILISASLDLEDGPNTV